MKKPKIGVFKFTSCDGCQLSILNMEEELLDLIEFLEIAYFKEATDKPLRGELDIAFVEGSISTEWQKREIVDVRQRTRYLITIGACATSGGLQALRNWANLSSYKKNVYPQHDTISALSTSTPISEHIYVDYELWGCPVSIHSLSEVFTSFLIGKKPGVSKYSLCMDCKRKGIPCLLISKSEPCLGPITLAGCDVLCPSLNRPCYGCFGPKEGGNIESLLMKFQKMGLTQKDCTLLLDKMNTYAYRKARIESAK